MLKTHNFKSLKPGQLGPICPDMIAVTICLLPIPLLASPLARLYRRQLYPLLMDESVRLMVTTRKHLAGAVSRPPAHWCRAPLQIPRRLTVRPTRIVINPNHPARTLSLLKMFHRLTLLLSNKLPLRRWPYIQCPPPSQVLAIDCCQQQALIWPVEHTHPLPTCSYPDLARTPLRDHSARSWPAEPHTPLNPLRLSSLQLIAMHLVASQTPMTIRNRQPTGMGKVLYYSPVALSIARN